VVFGKAPQGVGPVVAAGLTYSAWLTIAATKGTATAYPDADEDESTVDQ
jgi:hypothetical protein